MLLQRGVFSFVLGLAVALLAGPTLASGADREAFAAAKASIEADLAEGGDNAALSETIKADIRASLKRMAALFERNERVETMAEVDKVALFNEQERLNVLLATVDAEDQVVCERVRSTGSRMTSNKCMTRAERRKERESGAEWIRNLRPIGLNPGG